MIKQLKTAKWYWFIPIVSMYYSFTMSMWTMRGETYSSRMDRHLITILNVVFPNVFIILYFIFKIAGY